MKWTQIKVYAQSELIDSISEILYEFGAGGVEIDEPMDYAALQSDNLYWDYIDPKEVDASKRSYVSAYFSEAEGDLQKKFTEIEKRVCELDEFGFQTESVQFEYEELDQVDWETSWKQYFKPVHITERIVVKPHWEEYTAQADEHIIHIDPGMAFGTGTHETTSMCIKAIERNLKQNDALLDVGTGSGILSIAAILLGARSAVGVDLDPVAVEVARENVALNNQSDRIEIVHGDLVSAVQGAYDLVIANIIADAILILLDSDVKRFMKPGGKFICSGIILEKKEMILDKLNALNFIVESTEIDGEWVCITARCDG